VRGTNLETFKVCNSIFVNTTADQGGAVSIECSSVYKVSFKDGTFINNTARNGEGGAVYICSSESSYKTFQGSTDDNDNVECSIQKDTLLQVTVTKCDFLNANSSVGGGGLQIRAARALIRLHHCAFINCSSNSSSFREEGTLLDSNLTSVTKRKPGYDFGEACKGAEKGVLEAAVGSLTVFVETQIDINIINSSFISNSGGAVALHSSPVSSMKNNNVMKVRDSVFSDNHNSGIAPIVIAIYNQSTIIVENVTMESNSGGFSGGVLIAWNVSLSVHKSRFLKNRGLYGGALTLHANKLEVHNTVFDSNRAWSELLDIGGYGGALYLVSGYKQSFSLEISKTTFKNCSADIAAGAVGIYTVEATRVNIKIEGSQFL